MIKKVFVLFLTFTIISPFLLSIFLVKAYAEVVPPNLHKKNELSQEALYNIGGAYSEGGYINAEDKTTEKQLIDNDLIFDDIKIPQWKTEALKTEFLSKKEAYKYKGKKVDIFGAYYIFGCIGEARKKSACVYGGVTLHEGNHLTTKKNIGVNVFKNGGLIENFTINTDKKVISLQELDLKSRSMVNKKYKIYDPNDKKISSGYIQFHSDKENSFYDLFNFKGTKRVEFLQFYKDNEHVDTNNLHIDIYLYTE
ncbi:TPA: exotoxin [Staphylococcus pseudintermedius]|uniref:exotoxin beta-grasp domain-containing protein n=1 Tax=Staphylococcus pseudintermedius TaxID=283734 RepID=UPI0018F3B792|nr:exotoxin beta-grasp domain-containing protein [Staphylococcus pseudintermedius]EJA1938807.1 exotoxin [Staphylococcus pseudintermedius]MBJ8281705.1 exotoxin [Staphylococcus pseudintermedius]HAR6042902.1 exotoxin [Staphylococcus pseudintermedius]